MLLYPLLLLAISSTGTYAQSVVGFDYFDFDEPRVERVIKLSGENGRGRYLVKCHTLHVTVVYFHSEAIINALGFKQSHEKD